MNEEIKSEDIINKVGGRFKLTALIQRRMAEILQGSRPLVEWKKGQTLMEVVIDEILEDKIGIDYDNSDINAPEGYVSIKEKQLAKEQENAPELAPELAELFGDTVSPISDVTIDPLSDLISEEALQADPVKSEFEEIE